MKKQPSEDQVREYDETRRFCRVMFALLSGVAKHNGEQSPVPEDYPDHWRRGDLSFAESLKGVQSMTRDLLEMTADLSVGEAELWDMALTSQSAPTLGAMRAKHWGLVPKILKRGIKNDEDFYLLKSCADNPDLSADEQATIQIALDSYEASLSRSKK